MCLSIFSKDFYNFRIYFVSIFMACILSHTDTTKWLKRTFERFICLETNDLL